MTRSAIVSSPYLATVLGALGTLVAGAGGCSGGGVTATFAEMGQITCAKVFECCTTAEIEAIGDGLLAFSNQQECEAAYQQFADIFGQVLADGEAAGRVVFDAAAADACVAAVQSSSCDDFRSEDGPTVSGFDCENVFIPQVDAGGTCGNDLECKTGRCEGAGFLGSASGTCEDLPGIGESCDFDCVDGARCLTDSGGGGSTCRADVGAGGDCSEYGNCIEGHECRFDSGAGTSTCEPYPALDDPCTFSCAEGLYCRTPDGGGQATCQPRAAAGQPCDTGSECLSNRCQGADPGNGVAGVCFGGGGCG